MKRYFTLLVVLALGTMNAEAQFKSLGKLVKAGGDVVSAFVLSDQDVAEISQKAVEAMDAQNTIDTLEYGRRLKTITEKLSVDGLKLNFKVYKKDQVNAFACGDGSVRIYTGLMDTMSDNELIAIIGHEIGHVARTDAKDAIKNAYLKSAANNAAGAVSENAANRLNQSQLVALGTALAEAQYSQKQEYEADEYGFNFCVANKIDSYAMYHALSKLSEMARVNKGNASPLVKAFSTHPDSRKRAERVKKMADELKR